MSFQILCQNLQDCPLIFKGAPLDCLMELLNSSKVVYLLDLSWFCILLLPIIICLIFHCAMRSFSFVFEYFRTLCPSILIIPCSSRWVSQLFHAPINVTLFILIHTSIRVRLLIMSVIFRSVTLLLLILISSFVISYAFLVYISCLNLFSTIMFISRYLLIFLIWAIKFI